MGQRPDSMSSCPYCPPAAHRCRARHARRHTTGPHPACRSADRSRCALSPPHTGETRSPRGPSTRFSEHRAGVRRARKRFRASTTAPIRRPQPAHDPRIMQRHNGLAQRLPPRSDRVVRDRAAAGGALPHHPPDRLRAPWPGGVESPGSFLTVRRPRPGSPARLAAAHGRRHRP